MAIQITKRPYRRSFSGNPVRYELTSNIAAANADIYFEIKLMFRSIGGSFQEVHRWSFYPTAGVASFSVHDYLHSQLDPYMPEWLPNARQPLVAPSQTGEFYIEFREITPSDQNPVWDSSEADFFCTVVRGGINYFKWNGNNFWVNYHQVKKPFFTWQLSGRKAMITERMFLGWLCSDAGLDTVEIRCKATYIDQTSHQEVEVFTPTKNMFYYIPAGVKQWDIESWEPDKKIWFWEISLVDVTNPAPKQLSEVFRYEKDNRASATDMVLHYRNSLNGLDSFMVRGEVDDQLDYSFTEQARTYSADYSETHVIESQKQITETKEQLTYKGDIGWLGKEEQDRLRDAMTQREVYMIQGEKWVPVNIVTRNVKLRSTTDKKHSWPIEFSLAYEGAEFYTPKNIDLGAGVFNANVCLALLNPWVLVSKDFDTPPAGFVECTFVGTEEDPQNASVKFQYRLNGGPWIEVLYSQLPLVLTLPVNQAYTMEYQTICGIDNLGKKNQLSFNTNEVVVVEPPPFPITVTEVSNTGTVGSTRTQVFEYTGVNPSDVLPANIKLSVGVYSVVISVVSTGAETLTQLLDLLVTAVNNTTADEWNFYGSAPAPGTPGFKPTATRTADNRIQLVLNYQNQFAASAQWG